MSFTTTSNGFLVGYGNSEPVKTPAGILVTRAVETKAGWVGQIILDKDIVWESEPKHKSDEAVMDANDRVVDKLRRLFA